MANFCTQYGRAAQPAANFCDNCGSPLVQQAPGSTKQPAARIRFQDKRARVMGQQATNKKPKLVLFGLVGAGLVLGLLTLFNSLPSRANPILESQPVVTEPASYPAAPTQMAPTEVKSENGAIILPLNVVKEKKFVAFEYKSPRGAVPLLAYISGEGKVITAVSMCEPCSSTRFHIRSDQLICNSCGTTWELDNLSGISGACQGYPPDPVPNVVSGNDILIDETAVANWTPRK